MQHFNHVGTQRCKQRKLSLEFTWWNSTLPSYGLIFTPIGCGWISTPTIILTNPLLKILPNAWEFLISSHVCIDGGG